MRIEYRESMLRSIVEGTGEMPILQLTVRRDNIIPDTLTQLARHSALDLKKPLKIKFEGEAGIDEGGVQKEFFQVMVRSLFDPDYAMFKQDKDTRLLWFAADSLEASIEFELVGVLLGLAIYNAVILDVHFPLAVYRKLLGFKPTLRDLKETMPELGRGLQQVLDYAGDVEADMDLKFEVEYVHWGETRTKELVPGGSAKAVTNGNRAEYVAAYVAYIMEESVQKQYDAFARGFHKVCGGDVLELFRPEELELLVCGSRELDFEALQEATHYEGFDEETQTVRDFWDIVHNELNEEERRRLLAFSTGSDRSPINGLGSLRFVIERGGPDSELLPSSHTCFNTLLIPEYGSREKLLAKLRAAIAETEGFGLL